MRAVINDFRVILGITAASLVVLAEDQVANQHTPSASEKPAASATGLPAKSKGISNFNRASALIGMHVVDAGGQELGTVQDLVFDLEEGRIGYAVLSMGEQRLVPVPVTALKAQGESRLLLNMSPQILAAAPGIANDQWPTVDAFAVGGAPGAEKGHGSSSSTQ